MYFFAARPTCLGALSDADTDRAGESADAHDEAGDDAGAGLACIAAGGQCEQGAVCEEIVPGACGTGAAICCLHVLCAADAKVQLIQASDYDQSCIVDSDCVEVDVGNACTCEIGCRTTIGPINKAAQPRYTADVASAPQVVCSCKPPPPVPVDAWPVACCVGGQCQTVPGHCSGPADAGAEASTPGQEGGPADAGAE